MALLIEPLPQKRMLAAVNQITEAAVMKNELEPTVGQWYLRRDKGQMFRIVAVDPASGSIDVQSFDGDIEELDMEAWREIDVESAAAPEDWTGPYDDLEQDDLGYSETAVAPRDWRVSLESLELPPQPGCDTLATDEDGLPIALAEACAAAKVCTS